MLDDTEYKKQYDEAAAALEAAANGKPAEATPARNDEGKFARAEPEAIPALTPEQPAKEAAPEAKPEADPLAELRNQLAKAEKVAQDNKAWGTRQAQALAALQRESDERKRQAERPAILDANPELEAAIRHVIPQAAPPVDPQAEWQGVISKAHPGIFDAGIDPELEKSLMTRLQALGDDLQDPLIAIREITAEKIAHAERQIGKRFAAESAKSAQKSAMTMPGAGAGSAKSAPQDADLEAKNRILNMSPAEFEKERRRVMGY